MKDRKYIVDVKRMDTGILHKLYPCGIRYYNNAG